MSTAPSADGSRRVSTPNQDAETEDATADPHALFERIIRKNPGVCDTCFRRVRDHLPAPDRTYWGRYGRSTKTLEQIVRDRATLGADGTVAYPPPAENETDPYRGRPEYGGRFVCTACGHIDRPEDARFGAGLTDGDTADVDAALTLSALRRALDRCVQRAREAGYAVNEDVAFRAANHVKTTPETCRRDADIVAAALALGVKHAAHDAAAAPADV